MGLGHLPRVFGQSGPNTEGNEYFAVRAGRADAA